MTTSAASGCVDAIMATAATGGGVAGREGGAGGVRADPTAADVEATAAASTPTTTTTPASVEADAVPSSSLPPPLPPPPAVAMVRPPPPPPVAAPPRCVVCSHAGADLRVRGACGCAYHARCADLVGMRNRALLSSPRPPPPGGCGGGGDTVRTTRCPNCGGDAHGGLEVVSLDTAMLDVARRAAMRGAAAAAGRTPRPSASAAAAAGGGGVARVGSAPAAADGPPHPPLPQQQPPQPAPTPTSSSSSSSSPPFPLLNPPRYTRCYDPAAPRTGRWTDEELSFRDALITRFLDGSLPLCNGLRLNDFLGGMLKSKQSRLTKKMKHAKLSANFYRIRTGRLSPNDASTLSGLESRFVNAITDPVERSEVVFHMQREWREHLAERLTYLRLDFDASEWLRSVDVVERRVASEASRTRMVKRRCLMGRAMEMDVGESAPGVFISRESVPGVAFLGDGKKGGGAAAAAAAAAGAGGIAPPDAAGARFGIGADVAIAAGVDGGAMDEEDDDGEFEGFLMSMLEDTPASAATAAVPASVPRAVYQRGSPKHRLLLPPPGALRPSSSSSSSSSTPSSAYSSSRDPNFRASAPFLAGVVTYMERHAVPFEHVDVWVPSALVMRQRSAPLVSSLGSGSTANLAGMGGGGDEGGGVSGGPGGGKAENRIGRLCFGGSATLGTQIVGALPPSPSSSGAAGVDGEAGTGRKGPPPPSPDSRTIAPLTDDEAFNFSLFGDYSEMFSFSSGCGLPGRVFQSGIATWEQFLANAPPEMFERRGGAMQFGIRTALGLPIDSPNVGRIVLVLYSRHNRDKDEGLVARMVRDIRQLNPCPRWKLVVDIRPPGAGVTAVAAPLPVAAKPPPLYHPMRTNWPSSSPTQPASMTVTDLAGGDAGRNPLASATSTYLPDSDKSKRIMKLIVLLQENMPSDLSSPLGVHLNSMMCLRMLLLGRARSEEEEQLVETVLVLHESYSAAGRTSQDIAFLVTRDYNFHTQHHQPIAVAMSHRSPPQSTLEGAGRMANPAILQGPPQQQMMSNFNPTPTSAPNPLSGRPWTAPAVSAASFIPRTMFQ